MQAKIERRGGARPGSGQKPLIREYSEEFKKALWRELRKKGKEDGRNVYRVFADMIYDTETPAIVRKDLLKLLADTMVVKESKQKVEKTESGPGICLPAVSARPKSYDGAEQGNEEVH